MNFRTIALAGAAALALMGPAKASDATGWYLGIAGGWDQLNNIDLRTTTGRVTTDNRFRSNDSFLVTGTVGYRFRDHLRLEGELGYAPHEFKDTVVGATAFGGHEHVSSALGNILYDVPLGDRFDFSFGGGAGVGRAGLDLRNGPAIFADQTHTGFMWQGLAGFSYSLTRNVDLTLDWRYRSLMQHSDYFNTFPATVVHGGTANDQAVMLGLRWYLEPQEAPMMSAPPPPPPAPPPPPPLAPPSPPPVKTFIVFFDFNKSDLTAEALGVVQEAVKTAKESGTVRVLVTGHTDTVGSDSYNQGLSVRRAESVKDEMMREGMTSDAIAIEGKSFHDPLVPTGPGVREPQNRRAVIDLGG